MATRTTLPAVTSNILDFGLGVAPEPAVLNDSILILGTASDGPMYEPIPILSKDQAETVFGPFGDGTLVRGIFESFDATIEGTQDIRGIRVGNGVKSSLDITERTSTAAGVDQPTTNALSLRLEAIYPGSRYNAVSIFQDEQKNINIFNPKTGNTSKFTFDDTNPFNSAVDARNVRELVDAINVDPNVNAVVLATTSGITAQFEIQVNSGSSGVYTSNGKTILNLGEILQDYPNGDIVPTGFIFEADASITAGNLIDSLTQVFSISISNPTLLETRGLTSVKTSLTPFDGKGDSRIDTIQTLEDYDSDNDWQHSPTGIVRSEYVNLLDKEVFTAVTARGLQGSGQSTWSISQAFTGLFEAPDDSQEPKVSGSAAVTQTVTDNADLTATTLNRISGSIALAWAAASGHYPTPVTDRYVEYPVYASGNAGISDYINITSSGFGNNLTNPGKIIIEISDTGGTEDSEWDPLFYHATSGIYISGFVVNSGTGTITLAVGAEASGYNEAGSLIRNGLIASGSTGSVVNAIQENKYLRISCTTCKGFLSEVETLPVLEAATGDWLSYFFRGNEVIFSNTVPTDIIVNYGTKIDYEIGSDIVISDVNNGELKFQTDTQPGPAGGALHATNSSTIGLKYDHMPQFPAITTTAQSLDSGTDGTGISNQALYDELDTVYAALENYQVQIIVPMGAYLDATKEGFNSITGLPETVNAQFQVQLHSFLDKLATNVNETTAVMGVEPAVSNSLAGVNTWLKRLTVSDLNDPTRGANIMPLLSSRYIQMAVYEPIFDNIGGLPYTANGQASYAGMYSSLPPHHAPTNKSIPNAIRTRFKLSNSQLEALLAMRYVAMRDKPAKNPVISSAITSAPAGSDFVRLTTVRITFAAMDVVRKVCDPFIGQPNTQSKRNAMEAAITKGLQGMVEVGALRKYAFTISSSPTQQVLGIVDIDLILVPIFEIQQIRTTVRLRTEIPTV